jgi:hypothetical protein
MQTAQEDSAQDLRALRLEEQVVSQAAPVRQAHADPVLTVGQWSPPATLPAAEAAVGLPQEELVPEE